MASSIKSPGNDGQIVDEWSNPNRCYASNDQRAECRINQTTKDEEDFYNFGFTTGDIPSGATIDGFEVLVEARIKSSSHTAHLDVQLVKGGTQYGTVKQSGIWTDQVNDVTYTIGGATDLWGGTWADTDVRASTFGVYCKGILDTGSDPRIQVDHVQIRVYYTAGGGGARRAFVL